MSKGYQVGQAMIVAALLVTGGSGCGGGSSSDGSAAIEGFVQAIKSDHPSDQCAFLAPSYRAQDGEDVASYEECVANWDSSGPNSFFKDMRVVPDSFRQASDSAVSYDIIWGPDACHTRTEVYDTRVYIQPDSAGRWLIVEMDDIPDDRTSC